VTNVNSGTVLITYDGEGNRVIKKVGGTTTYYLVDDRNPTGYPQVVEEYQGSTLTVVYTHGLNLVSQRRSGTVSYYVQDGHGNVRALTSTSGTVTDAYQYDAYGTKLSTSTGSTVNKYLYCGEQYDSDLGLYFLRARYFNPGTGRFWTMDTDVGNNEDPLSLHRYLYCHDNPVNATDPSGLRVQHAARNLEGFMVPGTHQFIIMIPDNPADFQGTSAGARLLNALPEAQMKAVGGRQAIVVGAHNVESRLRVIFFQRSDVAATAELFDTTRNFLSRPGWETEAHDIAAPNGRSDTQFIIDILRATQNYMQNENAVHIPYPTGGGITNPFSKRSLNSNSWAESVLEFVGARPWPDFYGRDLLRNNRIPRGYFTPGGFASPPRSGLSLPGGYELSGFGAL